MTMARTRWLAAAVALLAACLWPLAAMAQSWSWSTPNTYGAMLALDTADNIFVAASDPLALTIRLSKTTPQGTKLWERTFDNPGTREAANWVAVDGAGNAIVTGRLVDTSNNPNGIVVLKYDTNGNLLWQDVVAAPFAYGARVVADAAGNAYVLGRMWLANASGNTTHDIVTIKYAPDGTRLWQRSFGLGNLSVDSPAALALTPGGQVIATGGTGGNMLAVAYDAAGNTLWSKAIPASTAALDVAVGSGGEFYLVGGVAGSTGTLQWLVVKHDAAFNEVWRRTYALGPYATRAGVDPAGNLIATGITQPGGGYFNWMTAKFDGAAGNLLWSRTYDQHAYNDEIPYAMVVVRDGSVYVTGQGGPAPASNLGNLSLLSTVTVQYSAAGAQVWSSTTAASVRGVAIAQGSLGGRFVLGQSPQALLGYTSGGISGMNFPPVVVASATPTSGMAPLAVSFSSAGTYDPDPFGTLRYWWSFGDGQASSAPNPAHSYAVPGSYQATLTVTDQAGAAVVSAPIAITVGAPLAQPSAITLSSSSVVGGNALRGLLAVNTTTGVTVALTSSNPSVASVPSTVVIPAGASFANFTIRTSRVRVNTPVTITATANGGSARATLTVLRR